MMKLYKPKEVMELAGISKSTFYRHASDGSIKTVKIGSQLRVREEDLVKYLKGE